MAPYAQVRLAVARALVAAVGCKPYLVVDDVDCVYSLGSSRMVVVVAANRCSCSSLHSLEAGRCPYSCVLPAKSIVRNRFSRDKRVRVVGGLGQPQRLPGWKIAVNGYRILEINCQPSEKSNCLTSGPPQVETLPQSPVLC